MKLQEMTMEELVAAEKAAIVVRKNIEDDIALGGPTGPIDPGAVDFAMGLLGEEGRNKAFERHRELSSKLARINAIHLAIIQEMENRLITIE